MSPLALYAIFRTWGIFPIEAILIVATICIALAMRTKADKKELDKKADKSTVDDFKKFIDSRIDDIKTLIIELARK